MNKCMRFIALVLALVLTLQVVPVQAVAAVRDNSGTVSPEPVHEETEMIPIKPVIVPELSFQNTFNR